MPQLISHYFFTSASLLLNFNQLTLADTLTGIPHQVRAVTKSLATRTTTASANTCIDPV